VTGDSRLIPVTELKVGDEILGYANPQTGRHFGIEVDEHIIEK
jgi:3-dehydroquinate synthase class II